MFSKILLGIIGVSAGLMLIGGALVLAVENRQLKKDLINKEDNYTIVNGRVVKVKKD